MRRRERKAAMQKRIRRNEERSGDKWALMRQAAQITDLEAVIERLHAERDADQIAIVEREKENAKLRAVLKDVRYWIVKSGAVFASVPCEQIDRALTEKE